LPHCQNKPWLGIARVCSTAYPDATQFDRKSKYFDPKATQEQPRWFNVNVQLVRKIALISIEELRQHPQLERMRTLQRGNRLSITPVDPAEWKFITARLAHD
jgi:predicted RNA-binding protein with PUA-like domain